MRWRGIAEGVRWTPAPARRAARKFGGERLSNIGTCTLGLRIFSRIERPPEADIAALAQAGPCDLSDVARGAGTMDGAIRPLYSPMERICGPAITVDLTPGDGLLLRAAIDAAQPGDVIVANAH